MIASERKEEIDLSEMKPVQRFKTLSSIRRKAEEESRLAAQGEMTEAERIFQENLDKVSRGN